jgi:hypothetical protein
LLLRGLTAESAAATYEVNGALHNVRSCHCSRCRKAFSAQASVYALVDTQDVKWLSGENLRTSYLSESGFGFQFCNRSGSALCGMFDGAIHGVTLGCVNGDPLVGLGRHIYVGSKASWETILEGVPQYLEGAPE